VEEQPTPGQLYSGDEFLADVLCRISRQGGRLVGEARVPGSGRSLKPGEDLVIHLPDGRKAFCTPTRQLASGEWIVQISRMDE
jgi:hypothetical protein